jgi:hypothetical protein
VTGGGPIVSPTAFRIPTRALGSFPGVRPLKIDSGPPFPCNAGGKLDQTPVGRFFKHTGAFDKLLRTWHWHLPRSHLANVIVKVLSRTSEHGHLMHKDAFDLWWEWAEKPLDSPLTIDADIHDAVMALAAGRTARPRQGQEAASTAERAKADSSV